MLVIMSTGQLRSLIERSLVEDFRFEPVNLQLDSKFLTRSQPSWEVTAEFESHGNHHQMRLVIDPASGRVRETGLVVA